jgi:hypothetical protein
MHFLPRFRLPPCQCLITKPNFMQESGISIPSYIPKICRGLHPKRGISHPQYRPYPSMQPRTWQCRSGSPQSERINLLPYRPKREIAIGCVLKLQTQYNGGIHCGTSPGFCIGRFKRCCGGPGVLGRLTTISPFEVGWSAISYAV